MGSADGNQDTNETPDLTDNTAAVEINENAQKVKIWFPINAMLTNSKERN